jgi:hypothetical protein
MSSLVSLQEIGEFPVLVNLSGHSSGHNTKSRNDQSYFQVPAFPCIYPIASLSSPILLDRKVLTPLGHHAEEPIIARTSQ